jgi:multisite-specific tRNA:(cytosine-C5)-methyltransferase
LAVQKRLKEFYIPEITSITYDGQHVEAPQPASWYPDQLAWFMTTPKHIVRRFAPFKSFQTFLVAETDVGNITRQEIVSMIPPLLMDIKPGMTVLDLCAAPGSKSAQLIEMLHAGEEERAREVASHLANGLDRPEGQEYEDDGRSTGLLIANDVDYKRAHMLVHQVKRLASPNIIVTNHDATVFPSIKIPSLPASEGRPAQNRYLKFDRILADVPCSGDGTTRKNLEIWGKWTPGNGLGLHATQIRILVRALQMLKVGGRVVYSTCSMNPVEDEAVVAAAIEKCGGPDLVNIIETKDYLPGLKRYSGLRKWSIMDKTGRIWDDYESVLKEKALRGDDGLGKLSESMFPPKYDLPLDRAIRVYPHSQDTGAFFITILEKKSEIKVKNDEKSTAVPETSKVESADSNGAELKITPAPNGELLGVDSPAPDDPSKRKLDEDILDESPTKRMRTENGTTTLITNGHPQAGIAVDNTTTTSPPSKPSHQPPSKSKSTPFEEPFKYLPSTLPELSDIRKFYNLSPLFPSDRFMVRNAERTATKNIYYTTALAKDILTENEGKGMKFVHAGVKMFVKQDAPAPDVCPWRIQTDGLKIVEIWVGQERVVKLWRKETLRKLLIEMFPKFHGEEYKNLGEVGEQVMGMGMGCCVLIVEPREGEDGLGERMVFPLWKSIQSVNLMLPKEERKAMLLRLFNDGGELVNLQQIQQHPGGKRPEPKAMEKEKAMLNTEESIDADRTAETSGRRRNSSSPEID